MTAEQGGGVIQFGLPQIIQESSSDIFMKTSSGLVFPLVLVKAKGGAQESPAVEIQVDEKIYDFFKNRLQTDNLLAYLDMNNGSIGCWSFDMTTTFQIMAELDMFPNIEDWIMESRQNISKLLNNTTIEHVTQRKALDQSKAILDALGILGEVEQLDILHLTANEVLRGKTANMGTMIYRMAMAIYHSGVTGEPILGLVADPSSAYLKLVSSSAYESMRSAFSPMMSLPLGARIQVTKVFTAFVIASYVYHKAIGGSHK